MAAGRCLDPGWRHAGPGRRRAGCLLASGRMRLVTTVTTSPVTRAALGGILLEHDRSLSAYVRPQVGFSVQPAEIDAGIERFARFVQRRSG